MRWLRTLVIFDRGDVATTSAWRNIHESYVRSIESIDFPEGSGYLELRRKERLDNGQWQRNGVGYLRKRFLHHMVGVENWEKEQRFVIDPLLSDLRLYPDWTPYEEPITSDFGSFDFVTTASDGTHIAIEWETGNISSSHRTMNKLAIALTTKTIQAGVLVVPSRALYEHLTDRIGNIGELSGYLSLWKTLENQVERGLLAITVVEHDFLTDDPTFPYLPTSGDGNAARGKAKRR